MGGCHFARTVRPKVPFCTVNSKRRAKFSFTLHWTRTSDQPALRIDAHHYKTLASHPGPTEGPDVQGSSETWRDPLVLRDPDGDLSSWQVGEPRCAPGAGFGQLEVLRSLVVDGSLWIGDPMAVTLDAEGYLVPAAG